MNARAAHDAADVVIVRAGAAGLHAADELIRARLRVIVLEARPRIGGVDTQRLPAGTRAAAEIIAALKR